MKCDAAVKCSAALSRGAHNLLWQQPAAAQTRSSSGQVKRSRGPTSRGSIAAAAVMSSQRVDSVQQVLDQCTGVLLDQFGVLHDGKHPYPHAAAAVRELAEAGKQVLILSNSSRRSGGTIGKLAKMGFNADWFAGAITSGELTHRYLATRPTPWWQQLGHKVIHITWSSRGPVSLGGLNLQVVTDPAEADFILAHGTEAVGLPDGSTSDRSLQQLQQLIQQCADVAQQQGRQLPMIVANPDLVTVDGPGLITMPGTLAKQYKQLGGRVQLMGKPDPIIYTAAQELLEANSSQQQPPAAVGQAASPPLPPLPPQQQQHQQCLAIGDSLEHDIAGAAAAGLPSLFVVGGIHAADVQLQGSAADDNTACSWNDAALRSLCEQHGVTPTYCMPFLQP